MRFLANENIPVPVVRSRASWGMMFGGSRKIRLEKQIMPFWRELRSSNE